MKVIIKLDDLRPIDSLLTAWQTVVDYLVLKEYPASFGSTKWYADVTPANIATVDSWMQNKQTGGEDLFEIFNHGFTHSFDGVDKYEFDGNTTEFQLDHYKRSQNRVYESLGITMRTFGAPYNQMDSTCGNLLDLVDFLD